MTIYRFALLCLIATSGCNGSGLAPTDEELTATASANALPEIAAIGREIGMEDSWEEDIEQARAGPWLPAQLPLARQFLAENEEQLARLESLLKVTAPPAHESEARLDKLGWTCRDLFTVATLTQVSIGEHLESAPAKAATPTAQLAFVISCLYAEESYVALICGLSIEVQARELLREHDDLVRHVPSTFDQHFRNCVSAEQKRALSMSKESGHPEIEEYYEILLSSFPVTADSLSTAMHRTEAHLGTLTSAEARRTLSECALNLVPVHRLLGRKREVSEAD